MSDRTPAPVLTRPRPDRAARTSRVLWALSFVAGGLVLATAVLRRSRQFELLRGFIRDAEPRYDTSTVDTAATLAFWAAFAVLAAFAVAELMLRGVAERRAGARWIVLLVLMGHGVAAGAGSSFLALGEGAPPFRWLVGAELLLGVAALAVIAAARLRSRRRADAS